MGILVNCFLFMEWKIVDVDITVHDSNRRCDTLTALLQAACVTLCGSLLSRLQTFPWFVKPYTVSALIIIITV